MNHPVTNTQGNVNAIRHFSQRYLMQWRRHFSREKSDTLLIVLSCLLVLAHHIGSVSNWIILSAFAIMLWRATLVFMGKPLPTRPLLIAVSVGLMAAIFWQYRSFLGRETGVAMLTLLLACKTLEMHARRDIFVVLFLTIFLLATSFFQSQSLTSAFTSIATLAVLLLALLSSQFSGTSPSLWRRLRMILSMLAIAAPLTILGFYLFPRIQGPLWGLPKDANTGRSGLSSSMAPGSISRLAMSDDLAFRVKFIDTIPSRDQQYWRAVTMSEFDGKTWSPDLSSPAMTSTELETTGIPITQEITLEPSDNHYLFGIDSIAAAPQMSSLNSQLQRDGNLYSSVPIAQRLRYRVASYPNYRLEPQLPVSRLLQHMYLPPNRNPRTQQLANDWKRVFPKTEDKIQAVLNLFRNENFFYTLEPPLLGVHSVDEFLFSTRAGFCEHYASSFVVLMRAMRIPARVVTGYQGGTRNTQDGYYEIKQSDAHAWAEVWMADRGWVRVDPTAAVAPNRILKNLAATQTPTGLASVVSQYLSENSFLKNLAMQWSAINNRWNQWVLNYNQEKQTSLFQKLGLDHLDWEKTLLTLFGVGLIVLATLSLPLLGNKAQLAAHDQLYSRLCRKMARQGYAKQIHEGPLAYAQRLETHLDAAQIALVHDFINRYIQIKYRKNDRLDSHPKSTTNILRELHSLLKKIK
ncbi:MAG: DUF3488 domain-containing transglutaminase family protein [Burkholderiales bacterium]|nr:DUF3488 domain-containing transglutaminase family protein [Burkholderiales bacterium]